MAHLKLDLLGPPEIQLDGKPVSFAYHKVQALLIYLAVEGDRTHTRSELVGVLWSERPQQKALGDLRHALSRLRSALGDRASKNHVDDSPPFILATRNTIQMNPDSDHWLDVTAFTELSDSDDPNSLEQAALLYRGDLLAGWGLKEAPEFEQWALSLSQSLQQRAITSYRRLIDICQRSGDQPRALKHSQRLLELAPWDEQAHRQRMRMLAQDGQRGAALAQYEYCRRALDEWVDAEPEEETEALCRAIRKGNVTADKTRQPPPHNLTAQLLTLIGRERELADIVACLENTDCRLLTLTGLGGNGKTRLAVEAGRQLLSRAASGPFTDGVFFVSLAPLQAVEGIAPTIAQALGVSFGQRSDGEAVLLRYLGSKRLLIILDNMEHLLTPGRPEKRTGAEVVTGILRAAPRCKLLITSRALLGLQMEQVYPVAGLDADGAAVDLFLTSARRARWGFQPTAEDKRAIREICRLVGGMPLALLLASGWITLLSPTEIVDHLRHEGLDLLHSRWPDVDERQHSIRVVWDHSWALLTAHEQQALASLSVFRGGFTQEAASQVAESTLSELMDLTSKSLVQRTPEGRYELHELLRQYAERKLDDLPGGSEETRDRHSAYYAAELERWARELEGPRQRQAWRELDTEIGNARAAWDWMVEHGESTRVDQAIDGLCRYYVGRGRLLEMHSAFRSAVDALAEATSPLGLRVLARALVCFANVNYHLVSPKLADDLCHQALALLDSPALEGHDTRKERADTLFEMVWRASRRNQREGRELCKKALALYQAIGDRSRVGRALHNLAATLPDRPIVQKQYFEQSVAVFREMGDESGATNARGAMAWAYMRLGQLHEAEQAARERLGFAEKMGNLHIVGVMRALLGRILFFQGRFTEAQVWQKEGLAVFHDLDEHTQPDWTTLTLSASQLHQGEYREARQLLESTLANAQRANNLEDETLCHALLGQLELVERRYSEARDHFQKSTHTSIEMEAQIDPRAIALWSYADHRQGRLSEAREHLCQALHIACDSERYFDRLWPLATAAYTLAQSEQIERAVGVYALCSRHPFVSNSRWFKVVFGQPIAQATADLPPNAAIAAQERGRAGDLETMVHAVLAEIEES